MREEWQNSQKIVIKIGSALLADQKTGQLRDSWLASLADDVATLLKAGKSVIIVSSGAIALGRQELSRHSIELSPDRLILNQAQAAAAIGQVSLGAAFKAAFEHHGLSCAQILMTLSDTEQRRRYLNARSTIQTLLEFGAIPVVNENDTVTTNEIRYGDNDRLAARVASMIGADCLVLLSDIDGLYTAPPGENESAEHIEEIRSITKEVEQMAGSTGSSVSSGGMVTKLIAAKIATAAGCHMVITSGKELNPLRHFQESAKATWFISKADPIQARKAWIAGSLDHKGTITIDPGAEKALNKGNSLLPAGVTAIDGEFIRGDLVLIKNQAGEQLAHGMSAFTNVDAAKIIGKKSNELEAILGFSGRGELVHRDDMALIKQNQPDNEKKETN